MNAMECSNFISCLNQVSSAKGYVTKNGNKFEIIAKKNNKTLNSAAIVDISTQCLKTLKESTGNPHDSVLLLQSLGKSLEAYAQKVTLSRPWWVKIANFICKLFSCKDTSNRQIDATIKTLSKQILDQASQISDGFFDFSLRNIKRVAFGDPRIAKLFEITKDIVSPGLRPHLDSMSAGERSALMQELKQSYSKFLKWMKSSHKFIEMIRDPNMFQKAIFEKSLFADELYGKYATIVHALASSYKDILKLKLQPLKAHVLSKGNPKPEAFPCTAVMPDGMRSLVKNYQKKGALPDAIVCNAYQDFGVELMKTVAKPDGKYYFLVRAKDRGVNEEIHQIPVFLEKKNNQVTAYILDSGDALRKDRTHFLDDTAAQVYKAFPHAEVMSTFVFRQFDGFNCGFMALKDIRHLFNDKVCNELSEMGKKAEEPGKFLFHGAKLAQKVKVIPQLPLAMMQTIQSLSLLKLALQNNPKAPGSAKLAELKDAFTIIDPRANKEVYGYTKFAGLKERLQIVEEAFA